jgi:molecular chaperone GrpE
MGDHRPADQPEAEVEETEARAEDVEKDLDELLGETKRERDEYLDVAKRTRADFENYRKRAAQEARDAEARGRASLARELVPVLDNLDRALQAEAGGSLIDGIRMVRQTLGETLARAGVEEYDPTGEKFDPTWHEALATRSDEATEPGIVLETLEKGYRLNGQVLRAARVVVSE